MLAEEKLFINGSAGQLETRILKTDPQKIGIICHPHPQFGGSMENNVVYALRTGLKDAGYSALRFNFRGVGSSDGSYAEGIGEIDDLADVVNYCTDQNFSEIVLCGYSFGTWIIMNYISKTSASLSLILVSPPIGIYDFSLLDLPEKAECLIIAGNRDHICPVANLRAWYKTQKCQLSFIELSDTDHFFIGREKEISEHVTKFLSSLSRSQKIHPQSC